MEVYTALSRLADVGHLEGVTNILKGPLTACPELVLLGLAAAAPHSDRRILQTRIAQPLALRFAAQAAQGSPASQALMHQLRDINGALAQPASGFGRHLHTLDKESQLLGCKRMCIRRCLSRLGSPAVACHGIILPGIQGS